LLLVIVQLQMMKAQVIRRKVAPSQVLKRAEKQEARQIKEKKTAILTPQMMILIIWICLMFEIFQI
jgi:Na+/H+ antiporter NhaD/arsenite permease-like protein